MPDYLLAVFFTLAAAISLCASWLLVQSLERVGARIGLSESALGMLAALAADAPEITAAVTALTRHDPRVGAGVVIGSNVFNLAALIGLSGVVAGQIALHRRVIELAGAVALWISAAALLVVMGVLSPLVGLLLVLAVLAPYVVILSVRHERLARLRLPAKWTRWLLAAIREEELELEVAIHPRRGHARDVAIAAGTVVVVVGASVAMEHTATELGSRNGIPAIVVGALVLAGVTSLPNAVAAVYLAVRGRGAAVLSTSLNSNALNIFAGLLVPTAIVGLGAPSSQTTFVAASALAMTFLTLAVSYANRGLRRGAGLTIIAVYLAFASVLLGTAS
ncbi:MAG: sodium:calcium antiporter [Solirubrobacterales bacterium]